MPLVVATFGSALAPGVAHADPSLCPITMLAAPGFGPFIISNQGDVWIWNDATGMEKILDCPPYDETDYDK